MNRDDLDRLVGEELALVSSDTGVTLMRTIPLKEIGAGTFAVIYQEQGGTGRVFAAVDTGIDDKDVVVAAKQDLPHNPHLPDIRYYGQTKRSFARGAKKVYVMPYYRSIAQSADPDVLRAHAELEHCWDAVSKAGTSVRGWRGGELALPGDAFNEGVVECARSRDVLPAVVEALQSLAAEAAKRDPEDYVFEFPEDNLALDEQGRLVLLDVVFNRKNV
jgi:hypothetical protein